MIHLLDAANLSFSQLEPFLASSELSYVVGHVRCTADGVLVMSEESYCHSHSIDLSSGFVLSDLPRLDDLLTSLAYRDPSVGIHLIICTDGDEWDKYQTYILLSLCRLLKRYHTHQLNAPPPVLGCERLDVLEEFARLMRYFDLPYCLVLHLHETSDWEYLLTESKVPFLHYLWPFPSVEVTPETLAQHQELGYQVMMARDEEMDTCLSPNDWLVRYTIGPEKEDEMN